MTPPLIRPARPNDALAIVDWFPDRASAVLWAGPYTPDPLTSQWLAREFAHGGRAHFVAVEADGPPIGLIGMRRRSGERRVHLIRIAVAPDRRGEGLAVRLIESMASLARAGGARRLTLNVYDLNASARRTYQKAGFRLAELTPGLSDTAGRVLRLAREL